MSDTIAVAILEPDARVREQVRAWLEAAGGVAVVAEAADGRVVLEQIRSRRADVLLADLAALCNETEMVHALAGLPQVRLVVLHSLADEPRVLEALRWGALGHLVKENLGPEEVVAAVRAVHRREAYLSPTVAGRVAEQVAARLRGGARHRRERRDTQNDRDD